MSRDKIIESIRQILVEHIPEKFSAILFGSQARGDYNADSDWDLLILLNRSGELGFADRGNFTFPIYELSAELGIDINPVIYTSSEWSQRSFTPFHKNVTKEGIKIWG